MRVKELSFEHGITINLGNREFVRGQLGMTITVEEGEDPNNALEWMTEWVKGNLQAEMAEVYENPPTEAIRAAIAPPATTPMDAATPEPPPPASSSELPLKDIFAALQRAGRTQEELHLYLAAYYNLSGTKEIGDRTVFDEVLEWAGYPGSQEPISDELGGWLAALSNQVMPETEQYDAFLSQTIGKQIFDPSSEWTWAEAGKVYVGLLEVQAQQAER